MGWEFYISTLPLLVSILGFISFVSYLMARTRNTQVYRAALSPRLKKKILFWCIFITVKEYKGNVFYIVLSDFACQIFRAKIVLHENFGCAVPWNSYKMWFRFPRSELTIKLIGLIHTTLDEFENAALFLRLGLPSTLLNRSRKRSFSITLFKFEEFENTGFLFRVGRKSFAKGAFWKRWPQDNHENCWGPPRGGACSLVP